MIRDERLLYSHSLSISEVVAINSSCGIKCWEGIHEHDNEKRNGNKIDQRKGSILKYTNDTAKKDSKGAEEDTLG